VCFVTCRFTWATVRAAEAQRGERHSRDSCGATGLELGIEGPTGDPCIEALRSRQVKNFLTVLLLAVGTPMLLMGDEMRRSQGGNNNAYCLDNETTWLDWRLLERHAGLHGFVKGLAGARLAPGIVDESAPYTQPSAVAPRVAWRGPASRATIRIPCVHGALRTGAFPRHVQRVLGALSSSCRASAPTSDSAPGGHGAAVSVMSARRDGPTVVGDQYHVQARSCVLLLAPLLPGGEAG
jgi:hypothetical protein